MRIYQAKTMGFCFGVKLTLDLIKDVENANTYGGIIHNPSVIEELKKRNINPAETLNDVKSKIFIITAHGISPQLEAEARKKFRVIDTTCPLVKNLHKKAEEFYKKGYKVIIIGDENHKEIIGTNGYTNNTAIVIKDKKDVKKITDNLKKYDKIAVISQTTNILEEFDDICKELKRYNKNILVCNTICSATKERQSSALETAKKVDLMVVVGGKNSNNTKRLADICGRIVKTIHIEDEKELKKKDFDGVDKAGITAGASTPDYVIKEVIKKLEKFN
jgi:(E)-4-hydroxy-3-methyl-but-2-enyl pyrophosphate reductase